MNSASVERLSEEEEEELDGPQKCWIVKHSELFSAVGQLHRFLTTMTQTSNGVQHASDEFMKQFDAISNCMTRKGGLQYKLSFH
jgi:hypothetical protein